MSLVYFWICVVGLGLGTLGIRCSFLFFGESFRISPLLKDVFRYIPAAVLPAILTPMVYFHAGQVEALYNKERLAVLVVATVVCIYTRSMVATVITGLALLWMVRHL